MPLPRRPNTSSVAPERVLRLLANSPKIYHNDLVLVLVAAQSCLPLCACLSFCAYSAALTNAPARVAGCALISSFIDVDRLLAGRRCTPNLVLVATRSCVPLRACSPLDAYSDHERTRAVHHPSQTVIASWALHSVRL